MSLQILRKTKHLIYLQVCKSMHAKAPILYTLTHASCAIEFSGTPPMCKVTHVSKNFSDGR